MSSVQSVQIDFPNSQSLIATEPATDENKIDVVEFALKVLGSTVLIVTNSILTVTVAAMKLTGFTVISSPLLGHLSRPLHAFNKRLADYSFKPFKEWSELLGNENRRIIETDKVISFENKGKKGLYFNPTNYVKSAKDSFKAIMAPISLGLSLTSGVLWVAAKVGYVVVIPGLIGDVVLMPYLLIGNKMIGKLSYEPFEKITDWMLDAHVSIFFAEKERDRVKKGGVFYQG